MAKTFLALFVILLSSNLYASCGDGEFERSRFDLRWSKVVDYMVTSMYVDVEGELCVGIKNNSLHYVIYRDSSGVNITASVNELSKKDIVFVRRNDFPAAAQMVTRSTHPLTINIADSINSVKTSNYTVGIKFLRNVSRGFNSDDLRLIKVNVRIENDQATLFHEGTEFDGISLALSGSLKINTIDFKHRNYVVLTKSSFDFERTTRRY